MPSSSNSFGFIFLSGILIGFAELLPGISGGTVAFMLGVYPFIIGFLANLSFRQLMLASKRELTLFLLLIGGMALAIFVMAPMTNMLLNDATYRTYLYSFFLGTVLAAIYYGVQEIDTSRRNILSLFLAALIVGLAISLAPIFSTSVILNKSLSPVTMACYGATGATALLLPGISGSYILNVLGAYQEILATLAEWTVSFNFDLTILLSSFMTGMLVAILLFAKVISYCLANFLYQTKAAVYGFMLGAVISLWPFREYLKVETANFRLQLLATNFIMPSEMSLENCLSLCLIICGWALVYYTKSWSQEENSLASS